MKIHDEIDDWSAGALCDALTPEERQNFERHLAECPRCRSLHEEDRKMNETLKEAIAEARPDANFERRIIDGFRGKIGRPWYNPWVELHPLRGLVWLMHFRIAQAAVALLIAAAMIKAGSILSGEREPWERTVTNARGQMQSGGTPANGGANGQWDSYIGANFAINSLNDSVQDGVYSGAASWSKATGDSNGPTDTNWRDFAGGINQTAPRISGSVTKVDLNGASHSLARLTFGATNTIYNIGSGAEGLAGERAPGVSSAASSAQGQDLYDSGRVESINQMESRIGGPIGPKSFIADSGTTVGAPVDSVMNILDVVVNGTSGAAINGQISGTGSIVIAGSGRQILAGANNFTGATTIGAGSTLQLGSGTVSNYSGATTVNGGALITTAGATGNQTYGVTVADGAASPHISASGGTLDVLANRIVTANSLSFGTVHGGNAVSGTVTLASTGADNQNTRVTIASGAHEGTWKLATAPTFNNVLLKNNIEGFNPATDSGDEIDRNFLDTPVNATADVYQAFSGSNSAVTTGSASVIPIKGKKGAPAAKPKQAPNPSNHPGTAEPGMPAATPPPVIDTRKLIRNAALEFEVASFEKSFNVIGGVALEEQGYIFSQNSAKGPNGKLRGTVVVKVLPQNLDRFLLKLRLLGDMKNQTVSAQDVTKDYTDTQSHIRNSEITEQRLIDMLKTRTGKVSDLLEVEDEIAKVRGEIEEMEGQLRVYDAQVQFATVTITLQEKDINQAAAYLLQEHAQLSLFAKDVEKAFTDAKGDAESAKAQTLESHIERDSAGRVVATLHLLIPPEASDEAIAKLKDIGRIDHFNSQTQRLARDGSENSDTAKMDRDKVELNLVIQQDAENPVQGTNISVQTDQVEEKTAEIKKAAADAGVEVKGAEFTRAHNGVEVSAMLLRMPMKKYAGFIEQIKSLGKVKDFTVARREDATATEEAPAEIVLQIFSQGSIVAPETGLWVTVRSTLGEGMSALMWSLRMIGVSLAWIAPWAVIAGMGWWMVARRRRRAAKKQG